MVILNSPTTALKTDAAETAAETADGIVDL